MSISPSPPRPAGDERSLPREPAAIRPDAARRVRISPAAWVWLLCLIVAPILFRGLTGRGFTDNEGMYGEIGREMLFTGDWLTPHINGALYLNKPPLTFWLVALLLRWTGPTEAVRLLSGIAVLATTWLVYSLGQQLRRPEAGAWSAVIYLTCSLTLVEGRVLRPDPLLTCLLCLSLWGAVRISQEERGRTGQLALWGGIGLGMMTKGLLGLALPAMALVPSLALAGELPRWRRYVRPSGLLLAAALVLPWHIAAGVVNRGFWWDYLVNQHLLFFLDRKFPRDSEPEPLWLALPIFAGRLLPWLAFLPAAVALQLSAARQTRRMEEWLPIVWFGAVTLFFSAARSRLDHYFMPAVPAAALLVGSLADRWAMSDGGRIWTGSRFTRPRPAPFAVIAALGIGALLFGLPVLARQPEIHLIPEILTTAFGAFAVMGAAGLVSALFAARRSYGRALGTLVAGFLGFALFACRGLDQASAINSPRALIARINPRLLARCDVVYEAGDEYQLCGSLQFYLHRNLKILAPAGFIPPTYLEGHTTELFADPVTFRRKWKSGTQPMILFTDPKKPQNRLAELPQPCYPLDHDGEYLLTANLPPDRLYAPATSAESPRLSPAPSLPSSRER